jgi:hypothetical protein
MHKHRDTRKAVTCNGEYTSSICHKQLLHLELLGTGSNYQHWFSYPRTVVNTASTTTMLGRVPRNKYLGKFVLITPSGLANEVV